MNEPMTRREFVIAAVAIGAVAAASQTAGCVPGGASTGHTVDTPSSHYGGDTGMTKRVLVGYATRNGSTVGVAEKIAETIGGRGFEVDVEPLRTAPSLEGYAAVVLGSAINGGQWLPEAVEFVERNRRELARVPVSLFCVHAMNCGPDARKTKRRLAYLDKVRALVTPESEGFFAGVGPVAAETGAFARMMFKTFGGDVEGDQRDWDAIRAWASGTVV